MGVCSNAVCCYWHEVHSCQITQPPNSKQRNQNSQTILLETGHNWNDTQPTKTIYLSLKIFSTRMRLIFIHAEGSSPAEGPVVFLLFHGLPPRKGKSQPNKASKCKGSSTSNCHADHPVLLEPLGHQGLQLLGREEVARETSKRKITRACA